MSGHRNLLGQWSRSVPLPSPSSKKLPEESSQPLPGSGRNSPGASMKKNRNMQYL